MMTYALLRRTALAALSIAGLGCTHAAAAPIAAAAHPRPVILFVHGRGHAAGDSAVSRASWLRALREGARAASGGALLEDGDIRNVWYADALDPRSTDECRADLLSGGERVSEAGASQALGHLGRGLLGALLDMVPDSAASPLQALAGDIMYLADAGKRCAAERRVEAALSRADSEGRPLVVVAHSMGGLVAYGALHDRGKDAAKAGPVRRFVTIGTPLAVPLVREIALGMDAITRPPGVESWINVRDPDDPFASSLLPHVAGAEEVSLSPSGDAGRAHDALRYLRDARTATAILGAWCSGFRPASAAPAGCGTLAAKRP